MIYYQPELHSDNGKEINFFLPSCLYSFQAFSTLDDLDAFMANNGYKKGEYGVKSYHGNDIEDVVIINSDGAVLEFNDIYVETVVSDAQKYMDTLVAWRGTSAELKAELKEHFGKDIRLADTTENDCAESKEYDYRYTFNLIGDDDEYPSYVDVDIYYLKMRKRNNIYITEVCVDYY